MYVPFVLMTWNSSFQEWADVVGSEVNAARASRKAAMRVNMLLVGVVGVVGCCSFGSERELGSNTYVHDWWGLMLVKVVD